MTNDIEEALLINMSSDYFVANSKNKISWKKCSRTNQVHQIESKIKSCLLEPTVCNNWLVDIENIKISWTYFRYFNVYYLYETGNGE